MKENIRSVLFGVAVGDALGVPVEFKSRQYLKENPVTEMIGHGTHNQPPGTWSDDTSLSLCLAETIAEGYSLSKLAGKFIKWRLNNYWTAHGTLFDIGNTTDEAISRLCKGYKPDEAGGKGEHSNGNGSLMRIAPLVFHVQKTWIGERFEIVQQVSSITHAHIRSAIACFFYLEFAQYLLQGADGFDAYQRTCRDVTTFLDESGVDQSEIKLFGRIFDKKIYELKTEEIRSDGYVLHTLEAAIWCLLTTDSYKTVVKPDFETKFQWIILR